MDPFSVDLEGLRTATEMLASTRPRNNRKFPESPPAAGMGPIEALEVMAPLVLDNARDLGSPGFFAHMDPPTPWITWAVSQWTASRNQNLLHPDVAPTARELERRVVKWFAPVFEMDGGHMTPGSTIANLTALWAAREAGCRQVAATSNAHLSVPKAAHILAMEYRQVEWEDPGDLSSAAAVITAGATSTGEIESLDAAPDARWRHVDAAWAGPLRLSATHGHLLDGIGSADSISVSAHKWLFQPKESAFVFFASTEMADRSISVEGAYLSVPNVGVLGSHGATAAPLAATVLAYGLDGITAWIDHTMELADKLYQLIVAHPALEARTPPQSGVVNWRRVDQTIPVTEDVFASTTELDSETWLRSVAANPMADPELIVATIGR